MNDNIHTDDDDLQNTITVTTKPATHFITDLHKHCILIQIVFQVIKKEENSRAPINQSYSFVLVSSIRLFLHSSHLICVD